MTSTHYDVLIIGSGFGGSVTAMRLAEKGYRVGVLEAGKRYDTDDLPASSWDTRRFIWAPRLGCFGIQRIHLLRDVVILAGAGVGGGSLNYANTLYQPPAPFFNDPQWAHITDWHAELDPHYRTARQMLGVTQNPHVTPSDEVLREVARDMGVEHTFTLTPVGVFFGEPGKEVPDPFFGGAGPRRTGCTQCGSCMTGCRVGAKNTLDKNYLYFAEKLGAELHPLTTVVDVRPRRGSGYVVDAVRTGRSVRRRRNRQSFTANQVVFAAGTYNTQKLLHRLKATGSLPNISDRLGTLTRTNSESILGAKSRDPSSDFTRGVAITSSIHPDEFTHIEPVRYGKGSNAMSLLQTALTDGDGRGPRWWRWLRTIATQPSHLTWFSPRRWSERTVILLVMQTLDNSITVRSKRNLLGRHTITSGPGHGAPNPTWIPVGNEATRRVAEKINGVAGGSTGEIANIPMTAHFIGGCAIGDTPDTGVIDPYHRLYGHDGIFVVDGSSISANLGVNPSLTITAQAERAASLWPNKGQSDPRPPLGADYQRLSAIEPERPALPHPEASVDERDQ
ncbi:MAG: GMC family oxidoreductase [Actinobacteria bacterium]|uniref:Cholesterol oxidase n=1 Tax=Nocardioides marinisabuli TaxID=419476 RepID=A0A7Y9F340_9ACTN|nr:GMC family oxidoreductase [Nocardioides marinisabuli]MBU2073786.1 GMC family oxidoreductase [Actinomycetota bacterium]MBU2110364.1 GMC family oxidoreductase [Actinomycetota bacterium]NYD58669.1 cholesterol oxidase [Nocardioides marinisabuli]